MIGSALLAQYGFNCDIGRAIDLALIELMVFVALAAQCVCGLGWCGWLLLRRFSLIELLGLTAYWCVWLVGVIASYEGGVSWVADVILDWMESG